MKNYHPGLQQQHKNRDQKSYPSVPSKRMQKGLELITLQGAIEKSPILLSQYWKN